MKDDLAIKLHRVDVALLLILPFCLLSLAFEAGWAAVAITAFPLVSAFFAGRAFQRWVEADAEDEGDLETDDSEQEDD